MREKVIERALVRQVKNRGGQAWKLQSANVDGVPDRIVILPGGKVVFVELKAPGQKMRPIQEKRMRQLAECGVRAFCVDSLEGIEVMLDEVCGS